MPDIMCLPAFPNNCCLCIQRLNSKFNHEVHVKHTVNSHGELPIKHKALIYKSNSLSARNTQLSGIIYYCRILHALAGNGPSSPRRCARDRGSEKTDVLMLTVGQGGHSAKSDGKHSLNSLAKVNFMQGWSWGIAGDIRHIL